MNRKGESRLKRGFSYVIKGVFFLLVPMTLMLGACGENTGTNEEIYRENNEIFGPESRGTSEDTATIQERDQGTMEEEGEMQNQTPEQYNDQGL